LLVFQKADVRQRPLGIAALEDKIVRQVVLTILNRIYEVDFKGFSYRLPTHQIFAFVREFDAKAKGLVVLRKFQSHVSPVEGAYRHTRQLKRLQQFFHRGLRRAAFQRPNSVNEKKHAAAGGLKERLHPPDKAAE
jgi:hypothetical protein